MDCLPWCTNRPKAIDGQRKAFTFLQAKASSAYLGVLPLILAAYSQKAPTKVSGQLVELTRCWLQRDGYTRHDRKIFFLRTMLFQRSGYLTDRRRILTRIRPLIKLNTMIFTPHTSFGYYFITQRTQQILNPKFLDSSTSPRYATPVATSAQNITRCQVRE